jgi:hypothetical protein
MPALLISTCSSSSAALSESTQHEAIAWQSRFNCLLPPLICFQK